MDTTAHSALPAPQSIVAPDADRRSDAAEITEWLLEGRFFTVDLGGAITMWSPGAAEAFAWSRHDIVRSNFTDVLLASGDADEGAQPLALLLRGEAPVVRADAPVVDASGARLHAAFAAVPIHIGVGYEFNALLQEIASSSQAARSLEQLKARSESVLALIDGAIGGRNAELAESDDARRLAGALVVFRVLDREPPPVGAGEPSRAADEGPDDSELRARADAAIERLNETVAERERLRTELDEVRADADAEAGALRNELATVRNEAQAEIERLRADLTDVRRRAHEDADEARAETDRIDGELASTRERLGSETARLLAELEEARERAATTAERLQGELTSTRAAAEQAAEELAQARAELAGAHAELERQRARLDAVDARDEALRTELQELSADAAEARAQAERATAELAQAQVERTHDRDEVEGLTAELERARAEAKRLRAETAASAEGTPTAQPPADADGLREAQAVAEAAVAEAEAARRELASAGRDAGATAERLRADLAAVQARAEKSDRELAELRSGGARSAAELEAAQAHAAGLQVELTALAEQAAEARASSDRARSELEHSEAELAHARAVREADAAAARAAADSLANDLSGTRGELDRLRAEAEREREAHAHDRAAADERVARLSADRDAIQSELDALRAQAQRAAADAHSRVAELTADVERLEIELAGARQSTREEPAVAPAVETPVEAPRRGVAKERASQYLDFVLSTADVTEAAPEPRHREPIAIETLLGMARDIDAKNPYTQRHSERVAGYAAALAEGLGFERPRIEAIRQAAMLHDVGKSEVREAIVATDDPLNLEQLDELARHSEVGRELLVAAGEPELAEWVRHIHERFDGGGFPLGLAGSKIPEESRVLHAADALDHMTRPRAYRRSRPLREALAEIGFCAGTRLDPEIAQTMIDLVERGRIKIQGPAGPVRVGRPLGRPAA